MNLLSLRKKDLIKQKSGKKKGIKANEIGAYF